MSLRPRKATQIALLLALCSALLATACGDDGEGEEEVEEEKPDAPDPISNDKPLPPPTSLNCPNGTFLTYENFGEAFMLNYCTSCHSQHLPEGKRSGAPLAANLDTPSDVVLWRALILPRAGTDAGNMPPSANVPSIERAQFAEWLNCGAPSGTDRIE